MLSDIDQIESTLAAPQNFHSLCKALFPLMDIADGGRLADGTEEIADRIE
jgi:hypothetical protein